MRHAHSGKRTIPLGQFPLPRSLRVRVKSMVSGVKVGSVELGLVALVLGLGLELGLFGKGNVQQSASCR